jgi:lipoprotein-releasing system permease protein
MDAAVDLPGGKKDFVKMGSYGIGVSRLVGAIIEAKYDDKNEIMKWPLSVAPYDIALIPMINKNDNTALDKAKKINSELIKNNIDAIIDDTDENYSSKIKKMNLIGAPYQIVIGKKYEGDLLEFKETGGETQNLSLDKIIEIITKQKVSTLEKEITFRFLKARKKDGFLNIISIFSFIGISLGVAVLIIVMSVMNGFRSDLINKIVGFNSHITVKSYDNSGIDRNKLNNKNLKFITKNIIFSNSGEAIILKNDTSKGIVLRGYQAKEFSNLTIIKNEKFKGDKSKLDKNSISIGNELSFSLDLKIGDKITLMSPSGVETIIGSMPKQKTFKITSIFNSGLADFDNNIALINLDTLDDFFGFQKKDRSLEIYLKDPQNIEEQKQIVQNIFDQEFIYTWADMNSSLFSALKVERNVMFIILSLIIIVAAFNIISGLTILVKNKTRDIAILKSIGVLNKSIIKIFFLVGVIIGTSATVFGIILGVTFSLYVENFRQFLSSTFNISLFPEEIYFLSTMPSEINPYSILMISVCSILITIIVSIFPAFKAANLDPVQALKYE